MNDQMTAVEHAVAGQEHWDEAIRAQTTADPNHLDFYALARELMHTLCLLDELAKVLAHQVAHYGEGRRIYDDTRARPDAVRPAERLNLAVTELVELRRTLPPAWRIVDRFWSEIGHVGVEYGCDEDPEARR